MVTKPNKIIKIALVDDHALFREGLRRIIAMTSYYHIVVEANNGFEFLEFLETCSDSQIPDVVLLDIQMPKMDGFETATVLQDKYSFIKIIACTMYTDETVITKMLRCGVSGYLNKNISVGELTMAIDEVFKGEQYFSKLVYDTAIRILSDREKVMHPIFNLSSRELQIIELIAAEKTSEEIAVELTLSKRTVDGHIENIMSKLGVKSRVGIILASLRKDILQLK